MSSVSRSHDNTEDLNPTAARPGDDWRARLDRVFRKNEAAFRRSAGKEAGDRHIDDLLGNVFCDLVRGFGRERNPRQPPATDGDMTAYVYGAIRKAAARVLRVESAEALQCPAVYQEEVDHGNAEEGDELDLSPDVGEGAGTPVTPDLVAVCQAAVVADGARWDGATLQEVLDAGLSSLAPMQQSVITELQFDDTSREDLARALKISVRTVDAHLQRAFRNMRAWMLQHGPEVDSDRVAEMIRQLGRRHAGRCADRRTRKECRTLPTEDASRQASSGTSDSTMVA